VFVVTEEEQKQYQQIIDSMKPSRLKYEMDRAQKGKKVLLSIHVNK